MKLRLFLTLILPLLAVQAAQSVAITAPVAGDILHGQVSIIGNMNVENFAAAKLDFAYASDSTGTWFAIQTFSQPVQDSALATWDTTSITDGDYILRLHVDLTDGTSQEVTVPIRIQNDTPIPTSTPLPPTATPETIFGSLIPTPFLLAASPTPTDVPLPTPTMLPQNPVSLNQNEIFSSLSRGALVIVGLFVLSGILIRLRRN